MKLILSIIFSLSLSIGFSQKTYKGVSVLPDQFYTKLAKVINQSTVEVFEQVVTGKGEDKKIKWDSKKVKVDFSESVKEQFKLKSKELEKGTSIYVLKKDYKL